MAQTEEFIIEGKGLSEAALAKKRLVEQEPSARTNHMEYMCGIRLWHRSRTMIMKSIVRQM